MPTGPGMKLAICVAKLTQPKRSSPFIQSTKFLASPIAANKAKGPD